MNTAVRLCIALALHLVTVAHAGLLPVWSQRFTSSSLSYNVQVTKLDPAGNVIVAGLIADPKTGTDLWVSKLDAKSGAVLWTFRKDGVQSGADKLGNIAISVEGDVFVAGALVNEPIGPGISGTDSYLARLNGTTGNFMWERNGLANSGDDAWHDIVLDNPGSLVVTGIVDGGDSGRGTDMLTARFDAIEGVVVWQRVYFYYPTPVLDQGERLFIAPDREIFVQASHPAGVRDGIPFDAAVVIVSYGPDGVFQGATPFREAPSARAYGFIPNLKGGFFVGLSEVPAGKTPQLTIAAGSAGKTLLNEVVLPGIAGAPVMALAQNGDILFTGRGTGATAPPDIVSGRLAPDDLSPIWVKPQPGLSAGGGAGFAHASLAGVGSIVTGIAPGLVSQDLAVGLYSPAGAVAGGLFLDGAAAGTPEVADSAPAGPAMDTNILGAVAIAVQTTASTGQREVLVRILQNVGGGSPPTITLISPTPTGPQVSALSDFNFSVGASDPDGDLARVDFFADGSQIGTRTGTTGVFELTHQFSTTGPHIIEAVAFDASGSSATTGSITLIAHVPRPNPSTGPAERTGPTTGMFHGAVGNLPLGGTARFVFNFSAPTTGPGFSTASVNLPASGVPQLVELPFTFPEPHRSYDYFLEVTATDGTETVTAASVPQTFAIPNAPLLPRSDLVFFPRGAISGNAAANDLDPDAGETLTVTYAGGPYPGVFTTDGNTFKFVPNRDFTGELIIPYTVDDGHGSTQSDTLVIRSGLHYAGSYRALSSPDSAHLGAVDITVNPAGRATAVAYLDGVRFPVSGDLKQQPDDTVGLSAAIRRNGQPDRLLRVTWAADRQLTAELGIEDDGFEVLYRANGIRAGESPFSEPQHYALLGTHTNVSGNAGGRLSAFASLQIAPNGKTIFRGKLGDGTPFATTTRPREDGQIPIYTPLRPQSYLIGLLQPNPTDAATVGPGLATVLGAPTKAIPVYAADYRDLIAFSGPRFVPAAIGGSPLTFSAMPRMLTLSVNAGGLPGQQIPLPVWLSRSGKVSGITGITRISLDGATGEFSGAFLPEGKTRTVPFSGVLRPNLNNGTGVFRGVGAMGQIDITPQ